MAGDVLAEAFVEVLPDLQRFSGNLKGDLDQATSGVGQRQGRGVGNRFVGGIGGSLKGLGGILAGAFAVDQIISGIGSVITAASDLGESINAVEVTFGNASDGVLELGENAATALGLSQVEFNQLAVRFSAFAETIAGPGGNVSNTLDELTTRASDFASVMNLEVSEAAQLFQSGLAGETEPLRQFGVDLSAASVQAFAYANGIAEAGEELSEEQKVQARYQSLLEQTAKTQGDFANTSDSLANRQRIMGAEWENLQADIGQAFVPAAEAGLGILSGLLPVIRNVSDFLGNNLAPAIQDVTNFIGSLFSGLQGSGEQFAGFQSALSSIGDTFLSLFDSIRPLFDQLISVAVPALSEIGSLITGTLVPAFAEFFEFIRPVLEFLIRIIGESLIGAFEGAVNIIKGAIKIISGILKAFVALFTGDWSGLWDAVKQIFSGAWDAIKGIFQVALNIGIIKGLRVGLKVIRKIWDAAWKFISKIVRTVFRAIVSVIRGGIRIVRGIFSFFFNLGRSVGRGFQNAFNVIRSIMGRIASFIRGIASRIGGFFRGIWDNITAGARGALNGAIGIINNLISGVNTLIRGFNNLPGPDIGLIPSIPFLQQGAVVTGPTLAMVGEGNESEAVLPLSRLQALLDFTSLELARSGIQSIINRSNIGAGTAGESVQVTPVFEVHAQIGDKPINDIMDVRIRERERSIRRQAPRVGSV